jgi:hypothetical protein
MTTRRNTALLGALLLVTLPFAALADPILDLVNQPVPTRVDGSKLTVAEARAAIMKACTNRRWIARVVEPDKLSVTTLVRGRHYAEISIPFDGSSYSIIYVTSRELDADLKKNKIHRNYNKWISVLNYEITRQLVQATNPT